MPLLLPLPELQSQLRNLLLENPADALKALLERLPSASEKAQSAGLLLGALNDTNKQRLRGTLSNDELQRAYNRIRAATLDLIDGLTATDFDSGAPGPATPVRQQGEILYRIPDTMPLHRETRCLVRIAMDEEAIVEDIFLDEHVTLKPLSRVSELMQVELVDPSSEGIFQLRAINTAEQMVEKSGFTEWIFYVTPMREGTFPLLIRVAVIELLLGKERKKEIVLEEAVRILGETTPVESDQPLKSAGEKLLFHGETTSGLVTEKDISAPSKQDNEPLLYDPQRRPATAWKRISAALIGILLLGTTATWAIAPQELAWVWTRYVADSPDSYSSYATHYPKSRHREKAVFRKAELLQTAKAYREYKERYPGGRFSARTETVLKNLEFRDFEAVKQNPDTRKVRRFLEDFPQSARLDSLQAIVENSDSLRAELAPVIRQKIDDRALLKASESPKDTVASKPDKGDGLQLLKQKKQDVRTRKDSLLQRKKKQ